MKLYPKLTNSREEFKRIPEELNEHLAALGSPHVDSFNDMLDYGLDNIVKYALPCAFQTPNEQRVQLRVLQIDINRPQVPQNVIDISERYIYPKEVRQLHKTYKGQCNIKLSCQVDDVEMGPFDIDMGEIPIMLKTKACNLYNLKPKEMVERGEHDSDWGGIFIVKGNEKIMRMLLMSRRNYPIAVRRSTWKNRGVKFTDLGILVRSIRKDETSYNNVLHFLQNGTCKLMFSNLKFMAYVPVCIIIKCLVNYADVEIYSRLLRGQEDNHYYKFCIQLMLREVHEMDLHTSEQCKEYVGSVLRMKVLELPRWSTNIEVAEFLMSERVLIHLDTNEEKFNFLIFMIQKLFACAVDNAKVENVDALMMQEVLTSGQLYQKYLAERIDIWMLMFKKNLLKRLESSEKLITQNMLRNMTRQGNSIGISHAMESFLATGNASTRSGIGLMQFTGLVIMAENINRLRYMSHFRAVHRGSFFTTMRTTEARRLLPDAWGFICPVHTPDGAPCGLLNHLTVTCRVSPQPDPKLVKMTPNVLINLGMLPVDSQLYNPKEKYYVVFLEGKHMGYIKQTDSKKTIDHLRRLKVSGELPTMMEIAFIPYKLKGQYPGLFLFVGPARLMRPVRNIALNEIEYIGTLEQIYMDIAVDPSEAYPDFTTHVELSKTDFLSNLANLIPLPDYNQSPRNMYQCQMGKQTMGTPCLNWPLQAVNKLYRLQTPATPLFRPVHYDVLALDDFAMGTNAIVAVISYTGYDMEDAMIINKMSDERGFAYGTVYKTKFIELTGSDYFARNPKMPELNNFIDNDGLPHPGTKLTYDCTFYSYYSTEENTYKVIQLDEKEDCYVESVRLCGSFQLKAPKAACITLRVPRPSTIGDKFASRAGQKGICSQKYSTEDLPWTETGLVPDIIFNPHGFPSRMTIAMMIEVMAGKSATLHGVVHDATPFRFDEKHTAINYFGKLLEAGGYDYYGTERLYSGVDGRELMADIFFGVVHYQRLRHMVFDKWQVRSTGPVDALTRQPIKGRKRGGGVRFGEMERDALIAHGAAFLLQDRLFHNSDKTQMLICRKCGCILSAQKKIIKRSLITGKLESTPETCRLCGDKSEMSHIEIPYAFQYMITEFASVNINARLKVKAIES